MGRMIGSSSISFDKPPFIIEGASIVGRKEGDGPLGKLLMLWNRILCLDRKRGKRQKVCCKKRQFRNFYLKQG